MNGFQKGNFARRAMELGGFPMAYRGCGSGVHSKVEDGGSSPPKPPYKESDDPGAPPGDWAYPCREGIEKPRHISEVRLIAAMRKIDPDLAAMIEAEMTVGARKKYRRG